MLRVSAMRILTCLILAMALVPAATARAAAEKPNIVVVLVDDMGFADIGCYGSEIPTPNIDRLAAGGLRFTQFYNTGRCCPTRAALLTGLYSHQSGVGHMMRDDHVPGYRGFLNDRCVTIADVLHSAGYFTAMTGKWHVGYDMPTARPLVRGFERFYGSESGGFYFRPRRGRHVILGETVLYSEDKPPPADWYSTDAWTDYGIRFIDEALAAKKPFFLYLAHNAPHFPLQAPPDEIARFRGKYKAGWDALRAARHAKQIELGIVKQSWPLSPRPEGVSAWDALSAQQQDRFDHIMAIYAACVAHIDTAMGRLTEALAKRGVLDNTLILFMSDNGGNAEAGPEGRFDGDQPGAADSTVFCGQSWAVLENTPFRRYKHFNHEGGIATPLVVHWPAGIKQQGPLRHQPAHVIDIMATCLDVSGATYPKEFAGRTILPPEGRSLVPAFADLPIERDALFWEHEGNAAVRVGDWKLVRLGRRGPWELYDLAADRTELNDLANEKPALASRLTAKWQAWADRAQVKPYPAAGAGNAKKAKRAKVTPANKKG
jgi:arylsulfatase A-like enzyme